MKDSLHRAEQVIFIMQREDNEANWESCVYKIKIKRKKKIKLPNRVLVRCCSVDHLVDAIV